jgi:RNA polymerase sigma-70 factor (ECF subfamily)
MLAERSRLIEAHEPRHGAENRLPIDLKLPRSRPIGPGRIFVWNATPADDVLSCVEVVRTYDAREMSKLQTDKHSRLMREALAHADGLHNLAYHLTRNAAEAQDLTQETYARAFGALAQFEEGTNLKAWLFRILRNTFLDQLRHEHRHRTEGGLDTVLLDPPPSEDALEPRQVQEVMGRELERAMNALTEDARMAVLLDLEGFSETEMAEVLGCAAGTVKSRLFRARAALRERLRDRVK